MFEAYVEQYFDPFSGVRKYHTTIQNFKYETRQEAVQKAEELKREWSASNFYVGVRETIEPLMKKREKQMEEDNTIENMKNIQELALEGLATTDSEKLLELFLKAVSMCRRLELQNQTLIGKNK
jgi:hypothetical protein